MAIVFKERSRGYQVGTVLLYIATVLSFWGVIAPGWVQSQGYSGLWFSCTTRSYSDCVTSDFDGMDGAGWATDILEMSGLIVLLLATIFSLIRNFCLPVITYRRSVQVCAIWGGIKMFIGAMVFVADNHDIINNLPILDLHYGPSFALTVTGSIIAVIAGIVIAANNRPFIAFTQFGVAPNAVTVYSTQFQYGNQPQQGNMHYGGGQAVVATVGTNQYSTPLPVKS